jgi:hypothetical protein
MQTKKMSFHPAAFGPMNLADKTSKTTLSEVMSEHNSKHLNEFILYLTHFNKIPNFIEETKIDVEKANVWFSNYYNDEIKEMHFNMRNRMNSKVAEFDDVYYCLYEDLLVNFDTSLSTVRFLFRETDFKIVQDVMSNVLKFKRRKERNKPQLYLLVQEKFGIDTRLFDILKPKLSIEDNYNNDFLDIHQTILKRLSRKNDKGIVLLHGKPGTGKTSYIRYLLTSLRKKVIFLPPNMALALTNPQLMSVLIENPNSVFVIEDAENIVVDREKDGGSPVTALLNIADGLLADCLSIQIICSFNTDLSKIDKALMRKGRLIAKYEFSALAVDKAQALSDKLGFKTKITEPMTLTSIYNQEEKEYNEQVIQKSIGFQMVNN